MYGIADNDHQSSLDAQSVSEDHPPTPQKEEPKVATNNRRASVAQTRPVVTSTTPAPPLPQQPNGIPKPSTTTTRPPTELKYASAVAAATNPASLLGLGPLPPPTSTTPHRQASVSSVGSAAGPARTTSPVTTQQQPPPPAPVFPLDKDKSATVSSSPKSISSPPPAQTTPIQPPQPQERVVSPAQPEPSSDLSNGVSKDSTPSFGLDGTEEADISMLPPGLRDLLHSFQIARSRAERNSVSSVPISTTGKMLDASRLTAPDALDAESKKKYVPQTPYSTPSYYPQLPHPVVTDPNFVRRCDVDTLFFMFYYQQETIQQ